MIVLMVIPLVACFGLKENPPQTASLSINHRRNRYKLVRRELASYFD